MSEAARPTTLSPQNVHNVFTVKLADGGRSLGARKKYQLSVGSMGLTLLDGAKPFKSYIYANLASWEAGPSGCTIYVGAEKKRVEFLTPDGDEITGLIAVHAQEIADKYMADRRRQSQHREQQEQRVSARRSRGEAEAAEGERPARRAEAPQSKQELRRQQLGTPPPSSAQPAAASADAQRERAFSQGVSLFAEEEEAAGSPPQANKAADDSSIKRANAQRLAERAVEQMKHANRPDDYLPARALCESALQLDPDNKLAQGTMDVVKHALKGSSDGEQALPEPEEEERVQEEVKAPSKRVWSKFGKGVQAAGKKAHQAMKKSGKKVKAPPRHHFVHRSTELLVTECARRVRSRRARRTKSGKRGCSSTRSRRAWASSRSTRTAGRAWSA